MKKDVLIEASILSADQARLGEQALEAQEGGADAVQVDVMDGKFVPNISFGPDLVKKLSSILKIKIDAHLMVFDPEQLIPRFAEAGAGRIIVHQEACTQVHRTLQSIRELGVEAGIALNPGTPLSLIEELLDIVDMVQVMTVNPGFGGQKFIMSQLRKIRYLRMILKDRGQDLPIAVDGGITGITAPLAVEAGAKILVAGTSIYKGGSSVSENIKLLRENSNIHVQIS
ncbi:MAG: ribulose-phosphate 3-epimerase [Syntrophaceae bacterium]